MERLEAHTCVFCNLDPDRQIILDSEYAFAIHDKYPVNPGHVLVIPKNHGHDFFELPFQTQQDCLQILRVVKEILKKEYQPAGFNVGINIGESAGQTIPHAHIHLIPRYQFDVDNPRGGVRGVIPAKKEYFIYPGSLTPFALEYFSIDHKQIPIAKCITHFQKWSGSPITETFGKKALLSYDQRPMFAELVIMNHFIQDGWKARWIETYGKNKMNPMFLTDWSDNKYRNQTHVPILDEEILELLSKIASENGNSYAGCWDVIAWKDGNVIFAESKKSTKDKIRSTQVGWLEAALRAGMKKENFLVVEWDTV